MHVFVGGSYGFDGCNALILNRIVERKTVISETPVKELSGLNIEF